MHGKTLGIIGMGQIGYQVARRALGFDMTVLYHNRRRREDAERALGPAVRYATKADLLAQADYVILCVPLTDETRGFIGPAELAAMKPTATLINISRGPVVDTEALTRALAEKRIAAAALDVTDPEPLPRDHPLLSMPNVVITPHLGSATVETRRRMAELSVENLLAGLEDRPLPARVRSLSLVLVTRGEVQRNDRVGTGEGCHGLPVVMVRVTLKRHLPRSVQRAPGRCRTSAACAWRRDASDIISLMGLQSHTGTGQTNLSGPLRVACA